MELLPVSHSRHSAVEDGSLAQDRRHIPGVGGHIVRLGPGLPHTSADTGDTVVYLVPQLVSPLTTRVPSVVNLIQLETSSTGLQLDRKPWIRKNPCIKQLCFKSSTFDQVGI